MTPQYRVNSTAPPWRRCRSAPAATPCRRTSRVWTSSCTLLSGQAGTGKTSIACSYARAACEAGLSTLYISFEESLDELIRNQRSIGIDLARYQCTDNRRVDGIGTLLMQPIRAVELGLEEHLMRVIRSVRQHRPSLVILDPISGLAGRSGDPVAKEMLLRLLYLIKEEGITTVATEMLGDDSSGVSHLDVSSIIDVWIKLRRHENDGEMNRLITVVKARGLPTSDQVKEFRMSTDGLRIVDPYLGEGALSMAPRVWRVRPRTRRPSSSCMSNWNAPVSSVSS